MWKAAKTKPALEKIVEKVAQSQEHVLREVGYRNYKKCARTIDL